MPEQADEVELKSEQRSHAGDFQRTKVRHWQILVIASAIILIAPFLHIREDQRIEFFLLPDYPFPHICLSKRWLRLECPGCGITRSLVSFSRGNFADSFRYHQLGWLFAISILFQIPFRSWALIKKKANPLGILFPKIFGSVLIALLVWNWCYHQIQKNFL